VLQGLFERSTFRRLAVPGGVPVVAVGGATFGGSGKTPLAIACAAELARAGARVVLVGHAYRADPQRARFVLPGDALGDVGDEALLAARALEPAGARVVVAPSRQQAIAHAVRGADVLVLDGVAQLAPSRAALALLALDAVDPWGGRPCLPPVGRLRAPRSTLLAACDAVVPVGDAAEEVRPAVSVELVASVRPGKNRAGGGDPRGLGGAAVGALVRAPVSALMGIATEGDLAEGPSGMGPRPMWPVRVEAQGAWANGGTLLTWETLRALRVGLLVALARPERVVRGLERKGVFPRVIVRARDHGPFGGRARRRAERANAADAIDLWLATPKCVLHAAWGLPGLPVAVLDHSIHLHPCLRSRLRGLFTTPSREVPPALTEDAGTNSLESVRKSPLSGRYG
jgi:tetraacyldisaccharide-1-P 4'-kinase